jgi:ribosome maturation factor RimP
VLTKIEQPQPIETQDRVTATINKLRQIPTQIRTAMLKIPVLQVTVKELERSQVQAQAPTTVIEMAMGQMDQPEEGEFCNLKNPAYICSRLNIKSFVEGLIGPQLLYMNVEKELNGIVAEVLENHSGVFLVQAIHKQKNHEIVIDGDLPLGIYDISAISREINQLADERMPEEEYSLDVASPGADSDLLLLRQYPKHIGREFNVLLKDETNIIGILKSVESEMLEFEGFKTAKPKKKDLPEVTKINYQEIKKANIILSFK